jgi:hypothetical protein
MAEQASRPNWFRDVLFNTESKLGFDIDLDVVGLDRGAALWLYPDEQNQVRISVNRRHGHQYWPDVDGNAWGASRQFLPVATELTEEVEQFKGNIERLIVSISGKVNPIQSVLTSQVDLVAGKALLRVTEGSVSTSVFVHPKEASLDSTIVTFCVANYRDSVVSTAGSFWLPPDTKWDGGPLYEERARGIKSRAQTLGEMVTAHLIDLGDKHPYPD